MSTPKRSLTARQKRFVAEYLIDRNGTAAYRRAFPGAAYTTARTESSRLLANPDIRAEVWAGEREHRRRCRADADRVVRELAAVAFADIVDVVGDDWRLFPLAQIPPAARRAVARLSIRRAPDRSEAVSVVMCSKLAALDKLCRRLGLHKELPPLEVLLNALPLAFAAEVRRALAAAVVTGGERP